MSIKDEVSKVRRWELFGSGRTGDSVGGGRKRRCGVSRIELQSDMDRGSKEPGTSTSTRLEAGRFDDMQKDR